MEREKVNIHLKEISARLESDFGIPAEDVYALLSGTGIAPIEEWD